MDEALLFVGFVHTGERGLVRYAGSIFVAEEFHIAAERHRGDFPARAMFVVEADEFGTKANGKHQHANSAPARHQKMTELVKEHDDSQNKKKWNNIADDSAAKRGEPAQHIEPHPANPIPPLWRLTREKSPKMPLRQFQARGPGPTILQYGQRPGPHRAPRARPATRADRRPPGSPQPVLESPEK